MMTTSVTAVSVVSSLLLVLLGHVTARTTAAHHQLCEAGQFQCQESSACISQNWLCDHYEDCPLGEDEHNCECSSDEFMCTDTECIPRDWRCDGDEDCHDGSDEDSRCNTYVRPDDDDDDDDDVDAQPNHHGHGSHSNDHSGHQHVRHMPRKQRS